MRVRVRVCICACVCGFPRCGVCAVCTLVMTRWGHSYQKLLESCFVLFPSSLQIVLPGSLKQSPQNGEGLARPPGRPVGPWSLAQPSFCGQSTLTRGPSALPRELGGWAVGGARLAGCWSSRSLGPGAFLHPPGDCRATPSWCWLPGPDSGQGGLCPPTHSGVLPAVSVTFSQAFFFFFCLFSVFKCCWG